MFPILHSPQWHREVEIAGIWGPSPELLAKNAKAGKFADGIIFTGLARMLDAVKP
jgi:hypothetical protein